MVLRDIAHVRTGDKGDASQISVISFQECHFAYLLQYLTAERVQNHLRLQSLRSVTRFELPALGALSFVLEGALRGGVTRSISLDPHGKTLGSQLLDLEV